MREGWTYKKLGEVATKIADGSHNPPKGIEYSEYPMLSSKNIFFDNFNYDSPRYLSKNEFDLENKRTEISDGDVLLTIVGTVGRTCCVKRPFIPFTLQRSVAVLKPKKDILASRFLMYALHSLSDLWNIEAKGVAQKGIYLKQLSTIPIPIPPLTEQERIVSELDLLSSIIEKKKEQLKAYDQLAQSIFYEMFGDPIENTKGWEVKKLGDICETTSGGTPSKNHSEYYEGGTIPWLRSGEVGQGFIYNTELCITEEGLRCSSAKMIPVDSVAIAMYGATVGQVGIIKTQMCTNQAICSILPNDIFSPVFLYHFLLSKKNDFLKVAVGGAQPNISQTVIKQTVIGIPPLSLQQSFASKIESIEHQKSLIQQSIKEVQTLFDSRMDYYFN